MRVVDILPYISVKSGLLIQLYKGQFVISIYRCILEVKSQFVTVQRTYGKLSQNALFYTIAFANIIRVNETKPLSESS